MCGKCIRDGSVATYKERLKNAIIAEKYQLEEQRKKSSNLLAYGRTDAEIVQVNKVLRIIDSI